MGLIRSRGDKTIVDSDVGLEEWVFQPAKLMLSKEMEMNGRVS